jgi:phospholipid/cholesterol/gamma-HCH transport system substrate-binding protein
MLDDDGKKPSPLVAEGGQLARIDVRPSFMDTLSASGEELIANFNQVAKQVNVLLNDDNQKQLIGTLRKLDQATARFASLAAATEPTVKALPPLINDTSVALRRADTLLAGINQRLDSFERAANSAEQFSIGGAAFTDSMMTETLPRLNVLLDDVQRSSRGLERLLSEVNEQPQSLIFGRSALPPGPGEPGFGTHGGKK